ncbi:MAG TPA: type II toxin-antitoxin system VapC family toxin [Thermoanaerobaculia bacterium]|nr:type II toxin-antitoxin system VapC family toxin [Thermoanaerobaculia bacterium]
MLFHLDTDFLVYALSVRGPERRRLEELSRSEDEIEISAVAWYEFSRGPRTAEQLAVARLLFGSDGVLPFSEGLASMAASVFRTLGSPRKRAADIAIGVTAAASGATLLTRNAKDFKGIPGLEIEAAE